MALMLFYLLACCNTANASSDCKSLLLTAASCALENDCVIVLNLLSCGQVSIPRLALIGNVVGSHRRETNERMCMEGE